MSTIKVDTYLTRGGASEIAIDKLKGASSAGSMTVVGEGGTTTTNLQQGLGKSWVNFDGTGTIAARDSLNVGSLTDNGTGDYTVNFTNAIDNANYSCVTSAARTINNAFMSSIYYSGGLATGSARVRCWEDAGAAQDPNVYCIAIFGDLA